MLSRPSKSCCGHCRGYRPSSVQNPSSHSREHLRSLANGDAVTSERHLVSLLAEIGEARECMAHAFEKRLQGAWNHVASAPAQRIPCAPSTWDASVEWQQPATPNSFLIRRISRTQTTNDAAIRPGRRSPACTPAATDRSRLPSFRGVGWRTRWRPTMAQASAPIRGVRLHADTRGERSPTPPKSKSSSGRAGQSRPAIWTALLLLGRYFLVSCVGRVWAKCGRLTRIRTIPSHSPWATGTAGSRASSREGTLLLPGWRLLGIF